MMQREKLLELEQKMNQQVLGQEELVRMLIIALLCDGHVLLEGLPGLAKTRAVRELARRVEGEYRRIQFTPICSLLISPAARFISKMPPARRISLRSVPARCLAT